MELVCPCCDAGVPLSVIADTDLMSERGRRNSARRREFGGWRKGELQVWSRHNGSARRCHCAVCRLADVARRVVDLENRIQAHVEAVGAEPDWAEAERGRVKRLRAEIEAAIAVRQRATAWPAVSNERRAA